MQRTFASLLPALMLGAALSTLSACGGGGGGSGASPPPPPPPGGGNQAPAFTSAATVAVPENDIGVFYRATASDPQGDPVSIAITGGADQARFVMNATTHELRFLAQPDFEAPADANSDNVYEVQLTASDGSLSAALDLRVSVSDVKPGFRVRRIASGLSAPIFLAGFPDGSGRVAVVERAGRIRLLDPATGAIAGTPFLDITSQIATDGEKGLLAVAFSPDFIVDHIFYVHMNPSATNTTLIRQYHTLSTTITQADPASARTVIEVAQPATTNHKGGILLFDKQGRLLIGLGDGGGGGDPLGNGQNRNALLGKLLRLDVSRDAFPSDDTRNYAIPAGNPFAASGGAPEVYALGLRNPFRGSVDPLTGDIWIGDVGQDAIEEVDRIPTSATALQNFGWNLREGTQPYNGGANDPAFIAPVAEYPHGVGTTEGNSVIGGVVYRGPIEDLQGQYLFSDFIDGNLWSAPSGVLGVGTTLPSSSFTLRNSDFAPDAGTVNQIVSYGTDDANNVYLVGLDGEIFRLEPAS